MGNHFHSENHPTNMNTILSVLLFVACASAMPHGTYYKSWKPRYYYKPMWRPVYYNPHHMMKKIMPMPETEMVDTRAGDALGDVVDVAVGAGSFKTLVAIVSELGLVDTLKGAEALTIFAPSDEAFGKIDPEVLNSLTVEQKKEIVLRHVVTAKVPAAAVATGPVETIGGETIDLVKTAEGGVQVNYNGGVSNVVAADVMASNGVIHVIDSVILGAPAAKEVEEEEPLGDVVDVAVGAGSFKTLVSIVSDLGLVDTLKGAEALTVFAPSDDAFAKIDPEVLASLTDEQKKTIVLRHVVTAKVPAAAVATGPVGTIGGESIDLVKTEEGGVQVNFNGGTSNVVAADVMASNGVIHVIDKVIL